MYLLIEGMAFQERKSESRCASFNAEWKLHRIIDQRNVREFHSSGG
jgi:hypothetical protein